MINFALRSANDAFVTDELIDCQESSAQASRAVNVDIAMHSKHRRLQI